MKPRTRMWLAAFLGLAVLLAIIWDRFPLGDAQDRIRRLPTSGFGFASRDLPLNEAEKNIFGAATITKRVYQMGDERLVLVIVDGSHNRHAIHDPTYCFRGAGWKVQSRRPLRVPGGEIDLVDLRKGDECRQALYWISDGRVRHASAARCWWQTALRRLTLGASGPEPVLVVVQSAEGGVAGSWHGLPERFPDLFRF